MKCRAQLSQYRCLYLFWSHCRDRSGSILVHKAAAWGLPPEVTGCWSSDLLPEDMPVSPVAQEQSGALVRSTIMSGWIHSCGSIAFLCPALHFMCLQLVRMLLWAEGDEIGGLEGLPCQVLQTSETTVMGRGSRCGKIIFKADWNDSLFLNGAIHDCNSSYICIVPKHTFLLWARYLSPLKLWEFTGTTEPLFLCSVRCQVRINLLYSSDSLFRIRCQCLWRSQVFMFIGD